MEIKRKKVSEQIFEQIKEKIKQGKYKPGDKLPTETALAEQLGVSRSPIREALRILEASGAIESKQGGRSVVKFIPITNLMETTALEIIDIDEVLQLLEVRIILESEIAALAAERRNEEDISYIEEALKEMKETTEKEQEIGHEQDILFHNTIIKSSKNIVLKKTIDGISNLYYKSIRFSLAKNVGFYKKKNQILEEHKKIAEAIKLQDSKQAKKSMEQHLLNSKNKLENYLKKKNRNKF